MTTRRLLAAVTTVAIAFGGLGVAADTAAAATMTKHHHVHHKLTCKAGESLHHVKLKSGKWVWKCEKIMHPLLHVLMPKKY